MTSSSDALNQKAVESRSELFSAVVAAAERWRDPDYPGRSEAVDATLAAPNRFTEEAIAFAVNQQMHLVTDRNLSSWIGDRHARARRTVGVLNAGNIPFVELQDFLAVLLTGHRYFGVLSSGSPYLLPAFTREVQRQVDSSTIRFGTLDDMLTVAETVIATGSDETKARVAELCDAAGIPADGRLLRGSRFAVAVIDGSESDLELEGLAEDMLLHEGLGCRNVAIVWAPRGLSPDALLAAMAAFRAVFPVHPESPGALKMQQAFLKAAGMPHAHGENLEFLVSKGPPEVQVPGHVRWSEYGDFEQVNRWLEASKSMIQLVIARDDLAPHLTADHVDAPGNSQRPRLDWCPDTIDSVSFLTRL